MAGVGQVRGPAHDGHEAPEAGLLVGGDGPLPAAVSGSAVGGGAAALVEFGQGIAGFCLIAPADCSGQAGGFVGGAALCEEGFLVFGVLGVARSERLPYADTRPAWPGGRAGEAA